MIIKPMVRNNICINSHPIGCEMAVKRQIAYIKNRFSEDSKNLDNAGRRRAGAPALALVIGCSTGYGLASRVAAAFGYGDVTIGVSLEKPASESKPGTPGFYNNLAFDKCAAEAGLVSSTLNGDAFSDEVKARTIQAVREAAAKAGVKPSVDLVVYSLASPARVDPKTGVMYKSAIKPIGGSFAGKTVDMMTGKMLTASAESATREEIAATVKVMGGEDWELWIDALENADMLSPSARAVAYTYIGPELSWAIYKNGTIGRAKEDLERAGRAINSRFREKNGAETAKRAFVSVNKALVTRASAVIPVIPFYVSCLFKVMKDKGLHEGCVEQITRLYQERLYTPEAALDPDKTPVDEAGRIRLDDLEMRDDVQKETLALMNAVTEENVLTDTDVSGFKHDFLEAHGFDVEGVDYDADAPLLLD
ncbi:MAG: trans-2-enoyl-CoA reductase family protein [Treponema sp.]|jgi:enoyl-[acyl-carrier protein] reductase/trans-2-enoyl-CoA reductase (NAD+)|nr:trans-2-enoyl-CoA reductase family protein [Treponema sp.]